jgi:DNA repair exonuclease SbcCD nuclease subunit
MLNDLPLIFLGDNHGAWNELFYNIQSKNLKDCYIVSVGDCGIGFKPPTSQLNQIKTLNEEFKKKNIYFKAIRGNHDDPSYFNGKDKINFSHFELLEDYSILEYKNKTIQLIGGAISIDRTGRAVGLSYWENEGVIFNKQQCKQVDILITHTAPSFCFPQQFNDMVYGWAKEDAYLLEDLTDERSVMDEIFKLCNPSLHLYGHFHSSWTETINKCKHKLLNINELWSLDYA